MTGLSVADEKQGDNNYWLDFIEVVFDFDYTVKVDILPYFCCSCGLIA